MSSIAHLLVLVAAVAASSVIPYEWRRRARTGLAVLALLFPLLVLDAYRATAERRLLRGLELASRLPAAVLTSLLEDLVNNARAPTTSTTTSTSSPTSTTAM